jgi:hypothetical protein
VGFVIDHAGNGFDGAARQPGDIFDRSSQINLLIDIVTLKGAEYPKYVQSGRKTAVALIKEARFVWRAERRTDRILKLPPKKMVFPIDNVVNVVYNLTIDHRGTSR